MNLLYTIFVVAVLQLRQKLLVSLFPKKILVTSYVFKVYKTVTKTKRIAVFN